MKRPNLDIVFSLANSLLFLGLICCRYKEQLKNMDGLAKYVQKTMITADFNMSLEINLATQQLRVWSH